MMFTKVDLGIPSYVWISSELMANLSIAIFMNKIDFQSSNYVMSKE